MPSDRELRLRSHLSELERLEEQGLKNLEQAKDNLKKVRGKMGVVKGLIKAEAEGG